MTPLQTLKFPDFASLRAMVEHSSLLVTDFSTLDYTLTGRFPPDHIRHAVTHLGAVILSA